MALKFIDISSHQSVAQAGMAGIDGVIVKATQSTGYVNPRADQQYQTAKKKGRLLGFYHYAGGGDPVAEANYFYKNTKNYFKEAVPAIDWESMQNAAWGSSTWVRRFVDRIHALTGVWPIIYVQASAIPQVANCAKDCGLWVAGYPSGGPTDWPASKFTYAISPWESYTLWQFTSANGALDKNVAAVDAKGWRKIANPSGATVSNPDPKPSKPAATAPKWVANRVTYTLKTAVNLRKGASTGSDLIMTLPAGSVVKTDRAIIQGGYRWVRQPRSGGYGYLVTGPASNTLAYVTTGKKAAPAATIKKGSKVTVTKAVDYSGRSLGVSGTYTVMQINGNRVVIGRGGVVTAAINKANLRLA